MLTLAIETATDRSSVVLCREATELAAWRETTHHDLLRRLAGEVGQVMARAGHGFAELDLVCAGLGPGSFTSLRVGLATAKGICLAHGLPLVGVPSLAALAWQVRDRLAGLVCPILDARRGEVYGGFFRARAEGVERVGEEFVADVAGLAARVAAAPGPVTVLGQMEALPAEEIAHALAGTATLVRDEILPDAGAVAFLGQARFGEAGGDEADGLRPLYVRKSYAEEKSDIDLGLR